MGSTDQTRPKPATAPNPKRGIPGRPDESDAGAGEAWLMYDGDCPACRNYVRFLDARRAAGELVLVNARDGGAAVDEIRNLGYDLDDGMVLKMNGRRYFGADALSALAQLAPPRGALGIVNRALFASPRAARAAYPLLKAGRRALLKILGRKGIGD